MALLAVNARFVSQPITGVQRYAIAIAYEIKRNMGPDVIFLCPPNVLNHKVANDLDVHSIGMYSGYVWEQIELPLYLRRRGSMLLLNLANTAPIFYSNKVSTVHDVAFELFSKSFSWRFRTAYRYIIPRVMRTSRKLITVSEFSRQEICSLYDLPHSRISVIPCGISNRFRPVEKSLKEKYILAVSSINYQKNLHSLIKAFELINEGDTKLYVIGTQHKSFSKEVNLSGNSLSSGKIVFLGYVDDDALRCYYANAVAFIFPSLYEGFGIPPLEAQACGCPCVVSNVASLPEIYRDSVIYCDPNSVSDIAEKINLLLSNDELRKQLIERGFTNTKRFSWLDSGSKIVKLVDGLISK